MNNEEKLKRINEVVATMSSANNTGVAIYAKILREILNTDELPGTAVGFQAVVNNIINLKEMR